MSRLSFKVFLAAGTALTGLFVPAQTKAEQCTTVLVSPAVGQGGRPMLWKNRDTDVLSNKVVFVKEVPYSYVGLVDAQDSTGRRCFGGLNSVGFAIMNTAAYNLPEKGGELKDEEGLIMADALRTCRTVDQFEAFIKANLGADLGANSNFGVFDAEGHTALFEVHNHGYSKFDATAAPEKYLVNTNFSRSGKEDKGAGYLRFDRATALMHNAGNPVTVPFLLRTCARDTGNALVKQPTIQQAKEQPAGEDLWVCTKDSINKSYTSACIVLVGRNPSDPKSTAMMWVVPGEPVTAVAIPFWVEAAGTPEACRKGADAPLWAESLRLKDLVRPFPQSDKKEYLNLSRLDNREGSGILGKLLPAEDAILQRTAEFGKTTHTASEYAAFEEEMVQIALEAMKKAGRPGTSQH